MSGQYWPEGDEVYHAELTVPVLLVHGMHDKFVPVEEDQRMAEVWHPSHHTPQIPPAQRRGTLLCAPAPGPSELRLRVKGGVQKVGLPGTGVWIMCCPLCLLKGTLHQTSLAVQWLALHTSTAGGMVRSFVGELESHMPCGVAQKKKKALFTAGICDGQHNPARE